MKINWKVRLRNPLFWETFAPVAVSFVYLVLSLFGVVPSLTENTLVDAILSVVSFLSTVGVLVDPTTKGISDSARAMKYEDPYTDKREME